MTQEQKELLLKDLCARLPYGVKISIPDLWTQKREIEILDEIFKGDDGLYRVNSKGQCIEHIKPYLFPLSSMTEEQEEELITITNGKFRYMWGDINNAIPRKNTSEWGISENAFINGIKVINILYTWLLKNHFDINGLIPMGLANDATGKNIY